MPDCIFCKIIAGEIPGKFVHKDDDYVVIVDINPKAHVHLLVIPRHHSETFQSSDPKYIAGATKVIQELARKLGIEDNYHIQINNGEESGQIVFHLHLHLMSNSRRAAEKVKALVG